MESFLTGRRILGLLPYPEEKYGKKLIIQLMGGNFIGP